MTTTDISKIIPEKSFREADVRATYRFLAHKNQTEIRLIDPQKRLAPQSIFVGDENNFVRVCKEHNGSYNIYAGINERRPHGTERKDVVSVKTVVIDVDAPRTDHSQPATTDELAVAEKAARHIISMFGSYGNPGMAMSGNGYQLWYAITTQQVDDTNRMELDGKFQAFQHEVIKAAEGLGADVDSIGDLPRIIKIIGTLSVKGNDTPERPHRCSKWLIGAPVRKESIALAEHILTLKPKLEAPVSSFGGEIDDATLKLIIDSDAKVKGLMEGRHKELGYEDRSRPEQTLIIRLIRYGLSKEQIWKMMAVCKIGKWHERDDGYHNSSYENALKWLQLNEPGALIAPATNFNIRLAEELMEKYKGWKPVWVVQDLIPEGALVIWVGRRASFKSWIVTSLSCSIAKGEDWLGQFPVKKSNVLIIDAENSPVLLADRLAKSGCKGGVYYYAGENFSFEKDTDKVIADCQKLSITVVALDTLRRGHGFDENNAEEISRLFKDYLFKFKLAGITLILLYHTKKQQQGVSLMDENDMIRGSGEFANLVDVVVFTDRNKTNPIVKIKQTKNRFAKEMEGFNVHVDITDEKATFKAVAEDDIMTFPSMLASAIRRQLENKKKGDVIPIEYFKEIAEQEGIKDNTGKGTLCRALNILMETGEITRKRKGIYVLLANGQRILQNGADSN